MSTIKDVARLADVSPSTVSKVINETKRFSSAVEARVWQAVKELHFTPNPHARTMTTGRSSTVGVVILDIANPYYASVVKGASQEAAARDHTVLLGDAEESPERELRLLEVLSLRVDGLVLAGSRLPDEVIARLAATKPIITIGRVPGRNVTSLVSNEYEITYQLTRHLIALGRARVAYLSGPPFWVNEQRRRGYRAALAEAAREPLELDLPSPTLEGGAALAERLLLAAVRADAVLAYNDLAALGFMSRAQMLGFRVPQDVAVAGVGDIPFAGQASPPLTTAAVPSLELGRRAVAQLFERYAGHPAPEEPIVLPATLRIRSSTQVRAGS